MLAICASRALNVHFGMVAVPFDLALPGRHRRMFGKRAVDFIQCTLLAARARIEYKDFHGLIGPFPIADSRQVVAMFADVLLMFDELVAQRLLEVSADAL